MNLYILLNVSKNISYATAFNPSFLGKCTWTENWVWREHLSQMNLWFCIFFFTGATYVGPSESPIFSYSFHSLISMVNFFLYVYELNDHVLYFLIRRVFDK